jgi:hypothetical protein
LHDTFVGVEEAGAVMGGAVFTASMVTVSVEGAKPRVRTNPPASVAVPLVGVLPSWSGMWKE